MNCSLNTQCSYLYLHQPHEAGKHWTFLVGRAGHVVGRETTNRKAEQNVLISQRLSVSTHPWTPKANETAVQRDTTDLDKQFQNFTKNYGDGQYI